MLACWRCPRPFFFFNPCAQFCHQADLGAVITMKHRAPCRYSLTTMPAQLLAPVKQQKTIGWSAAASIKCAAGRASQADSWEVVCRGKAEGVCRGKVALRDLLEKLRGWGSVGSGAHLAQMLWSKPPRFKAAASAAWTPAEPAFCSAKKKNMIKAGAWAELLFFSSRIQPAAAWKGNGLIKGWAVLQAALEFKVRLSEPIPYQELRGFVQLIPFKQRKPSNTLWTGTTR